MKLADVPPVPEAGKKATESADKPPVRAKQQTPERPKAAPTLGMPTLVQVLIGLACALFLVIFLIVSIVIVAVSVRHKPKDS